MLYLLGGSNWQRSKLEDPKEWDLEGHVMNLQMHVKNAVSEKY